jgi:glycine oxidase
VKIWDVIIAGGGIIGLSLSLALRKRGLSVLLIERGEPGREASHAAAGMLADFSAELPPALLPLATASAKMYPEFVHELQDESGVRVDLREQGTLLVGWHKHLTLHAESGLEMLTPGAVDELEPELRKQNGAVFFRKERSVDPRLLTNAALLAAKHREVDIVSGNAVEKVIIAAGHAAGVIAGKTTYTAPIVVNCAGAWSANIGSPALPVHPVKGHMLALVGAPGLRHVIRTPNVYLVPRADGRLVIGSTLEDAGYDKRVDIDKIQRLRELALELVPSLSKARLHKAWTGLRPASSDGLPILGPAAIEGYFVATGHYRDGILLTPVTARIMAQVIAGEKTDYNLHPFLPLRFEQQELATG